MVTMSFRSMTYNNSTNIGKDDIYILWLLNDHVTELNQLKVQAPLAESDELYVSNLEGQTEKTESTCFF